MTPHPHLYLTTAIPYVNAAPHLGFVLELVQADVLARHHRRRGWAVRFQSGTDDNSLKNVAAAEAAGRDVPSFVDANAAAYARLRRPLDLSFDDFLRTGADPRHRPAVERLWRACEASGDLYRKHYDGRYCVGCEQFYAEADLAADGCCPEHGSVPEPVAEENWFFRLSRHEAAIDDLITGGRLRIHPENRRNEALAFIERGLDDVSVSRSARRARGWGIPVPDDPDQVIYVWFDALANYLSGLSYGGAEAVPPDIGRWWLHGERRVHVVGKGILRFHAVLWPAILRSAGLPPPTDVVVHDYLTVDGRKLGKSSGPTVDPVDLVHRFGTDAVRWWLVRDVARRGDTDFTVERLVDRANADLANGFGNLAHRVATLIEHRFDGAARALRDEPGDGLGRGDGDGDGEPGLRLLAACEALPAQIDEALGDFDVRRASGALLEVVAATNRYLDTVRPWALTGPRLERSLALLVHTGRTLGTELEPFVPDLAARLVERFDGSAATAPVFARLER